jgi:glutamyl-tRNA synthetase
MTNPYFYDILLPVIQMNGNKIIGRFAPSPSGRLHLGNMLSSLLAWLDVRSLGGRMLFRLEDLDPDRSFREYAKLMAEDLLWLGLDWDDGWRPDGGTEFAQGQRTALYEQAFQTLQDLGVLYPCYCSRAQRLAASAPHPGDHRESGCGCRMMTDANRRLMERNHRLPATKVHVSNAEISFIDGHYGPQIFSFCAGRDDFIIRRADGVFAYQLAVSVDDAMMGVTRVVRARDLLDSTPKQIWLMTQLGYAPCIYCHGPLLVADAGRKMSKRDGDLNMEALRARNTSEELCGKLAYLAGLLPEPVPIKAADLVPLFSWDKVRKSDIPLPDNLF